MELFSNLDNLLEKYSIVFQKVTLLGKNKIEILNNKEINCKGVYVIYHGESIIYIGSSGKLNSDLIQNKSTIKSRLKSAYTPYKFIDNFYCYKINNDKKYDQKISIKEIKIICFLIEDRQILSSALEHILIQAHINQFKALPIVNQKI